MSTRTGMMSFVPGAATAEAAAPTATVIVLWAKTEGETNAVLANPRRQARA
jgi:hypothetical protein